MILNILFKLIVFFIFALQLSASTKDIAKSEAEKIAEISSSFLYTLDEKQLSHTLNALVYDNKKIKALTVTENLEDKVMFSFYRDRDVLFFTEKIPKNLKYYFKIKQTIFFKDENIGYLTLYYDLNTNNNINFTSNTNSNDILSKEEKKFLSDNEFITYYNSKGWYPFIFLEDNLVKGISVDFWDEITKDSNIKISYEAVDSFSKMLELIKTKANTIVTSTAETKERKEYASFTKPYASFPIAIATNSKENFLLDLKELEGKKVAVGKSYSAHKLLQKHYPKIDFVPVKNIQTALDLLANGKVYAAADILPVINYELNKYGFTNLKISGTSKFNFDIQIMVNKQSEQLVPILNKLIDNIDENEKQKIINKWLHNTRIEKIDYTIAYWVTFVAFLIISFIFYRQIILRKQKIAIEKEVKLATQELKELNQIHEETQELAKIATIKKNLKTGKCWVSKQFYKIFEFEQDSGITTEKILSIVDEDYKSALMNFFQKNEEYKDSFINKDNLEIKIITQNHNIKYLELFLSCEFDENFQASQRKVTIQDITEKVLAKKEEEKKEAIFLQQSKLASMGEMIGAIAHQWRQPLNELSIRIQKLKYDYAKEKVDEEFIKEFIKKNKNTIDFMSKTIDDFRNFFRIDKEKKDFHIKEAIEEVLNIQNAQLKNHHIDLELNGDDFLYEGFKTEFQQVIINLISNSKDALVQNNIQKPKIQIDIKEDIIKIRDNGGGIPQDVIERVFEPYFTTKQQGEGTGMGLYMSKMIIEDNMGGKLTIENENDGVLITIDLKGNYA